MNKKLALALVIILLLIYAVRERSDHAKNAMEAVDIISRVARENPAPEKIQETIGFGTNPSKETIADGGYGLRFKRTDGEVQYTFYIYDGKIKWMTSHEQFNLPRGISYELLEKEYVKTLTRRFGFSPKIEEEKGILPGVKRTRFVWGNIDMFMRYEKLSSVSKPISYLIQKKRDEMAVFIHYNIVN
jgi:hypothetical protein